MEEDIKEILGEQSDAEFYVNFFGDAVMCALIRWLSERNPVLPKEFVQKLQSCIQILVKTQERLEAETVE